MWLLQVVPLFAIYTFAPAVLSAFGLSAGASPLGSIAIMLAFLVGSLLSLPLVEWWGRRPLCIAGFAMAPMACAGVSTGWPSVIIICFLIYALGIGAAAGLELIYPAELFPTPMRATATGIAAAVSRVGAAFGTFALPVLLAHYGAAVVAVGACLISLAGLVVSLRWAPETRGHQLA